MALEARGLECGASCRRRGRGVDVGAEREEHVHERDGAGFGGGLDGGAALVAGYAGRVDVFRGAGVEELADEADVAYTRIIINIQT